MITQTLLRNLNTATYSISYQACYQMLVQEKITHMGANETVNI